MDKKGYIKTIEAVIAIMAILIFLFTTFPDRSIKESDTPKIVKSSQEFIVNEILTNEEIMKWI